MVPVTNPCRRFVLCYAKKADDEVVKWLEGPKLVGGFVESRCWSPVIAFQSALRVLPERFGDEPVHNWLEDNLEFWLSTLPKCDLIVRYTAVGSLTPRGPKGEQEIGVFFPTLRTTLDQLFIQNSKSAVWETTALGNLREGQHRSTFSSLVYVSQNSYGCGPLYLGSESEISRIALMIQGYFGEDRTKTVESNHSGAMDEGAAWLGLDRF